MLGLHDQRAITYSLIGAMIAALLLSNGLGRVKASSDKRRFTTQDSIEMSYIVDPARFTDIGTRERQPVDFATLNWPQFGRLIWPHLKR